MDDKAAFQKFEKLAIFVKKDLFNVLNARANFLFAQCIFNYIEIFGSFLQPNGNCTKRFEAFWDRLIQCSPSQNIYVTVLKSLAPTKSKKLYDILRCGLSHEGLPKEKPFTIGNPHKHVQLGQLRNLRIKLPNGNIIDQEGGIFIYDTTLYINNAYLFADFKDALDRYIGELKEDIDNNYRSDRLKKFCERAAKINFDNFD